MTQDKITCTLCGLSWPVPENMKLDKETYEKKFRCLCQKVLPGYRYAKCQKHNYGQLFVENNPDSWKCPQCKQEETISKSPRINLGTMPNSMRAFIEPTPYEFDQMMKRMTEDKK